MTREVIPCCSQVFLHDDDIEVFPEFVSHFFQSGTWRETEFLVERDALRVFRRDVGENDADSPFLGVGFQQVEAHFARPDVGVVWKDEIADFRRVSESRLGMIGTQVTESGGGSRVGFFDGVCRVVLYFL